MTASSMQPFQSIRSPAFIGPEFLDLALMQWQGLEPGQDWASADDTSVLSDASTLDFDAAPVAPARRVLPFGVLLEAFLRGMMLGEGRTCSLIRLQALLRSDSRANQLPPGFARDAVFHFAFRVEDFLLQLQGFLERLCSVAPAGCQLWCEHYFLWLQCLRLPVRCRLIYAGFLAGVWFAVMQHSFTAWDM